MIRSGEGGAVTEYTIWEGVEPVASVRIFTNSMSGAWSRKATEPPCLGFPSSQLGPALAHPLSWVFTCATYERTAFRITCILHIPSLYHTLSRYTFTSHGTVLLQCYSHSARGMHHDLIVLVPMLPCCALLQHEVFGLCSPKEGILLLSGTPDKVLFQIEGSLVCVCNSVAPHQMAGLQPLRLPCVLEVCADSVQPAVPRLIRVCLQS